MNRSQFRGIVIEPSSVHKQANRNFFDWIHDLDEHPEHIRPLHFYFYADEEADAYRLAAELKNLDFKIVQVMESMSEQWLCLAEMDLVPDPTVMDKCTDLLFEVADRYEVTYDGWETRMDL